MHKLAKFIYFKVLGWQLVGNTNMSKDTVKKAVLTALPHTSWHYFSLGLLLRKVIGIKSSFIGNKELFVWPFRYYYRAIGGSPIDRSSGQNRVQATAKLFEHNDEFRLT